MSNETVSAENNPTFMDIPATSKKRQRTEGANDGDLFTNPKSPKVSNLVVNEDELQFPYVIHRPSPVAGCTDIFFTISASQIRFGNKKYARDASNTRTTNDEPSFDHFDYFSIFKDITATNEAILKQIKDGDLRNHLTTALKAYYDTKVASSSFPREDEWMKRRQILQRKISMDTSTCNVQTIYLYLDRGRNFRFVVGTTCLVTTHAMFCAVEQVLLQQAPFSLRKLVQSALSADALRCEKMKKRHDFIMDPDNKDVAIGDLITFDSEKQNSLFVQLPIEHVDDHVAKIVVWRSDYDDDTCEEEGEGDDDEKSNSDDTM